MVNFIKIIIIKNLLKNKYNLSKDSFGLIYVGRINKDKGITDLINIYISLRKTFKNKIFLILVERTKLIFFKNISSSTLKKT